MTENNLQLFDDDHARLGELLDRLDLIPESELKAKWPQLLAELIDLLAAELQRQKINTANPRLVASKLALAMAKYFGGFSYYLPNGDAIKQAIRDNDIFSRWKGDVHELARMYHLTQPQIYAILREQQRLHRRRYQIDMFNNE